MNAPISATINNIEFFKDIISEDVIKETLDRHGQIQKNKENTLRSLDKFRKSCDHNSVQLQKLGLAFKQQSNTFKDLKTSCSDLNASMEQLRNSANKLTEALTSTADTIRKNLSKSSANLYR